MPEFELTVLEVRVWLGVSPTGVDNTYWVTIYDLVTLAVTYLPNLNKKPYGNLYN